MASSITMNDHQLLRYSRHILLDEIGTEGQEKLLGAHTPVVGCGGLGAATLPYLVASGISRLTIVNPDAIDDTNLQCQITFTEADIGRFRTLIMEGRLKNINSQAGIAALPEKFTEARLTEFMRATDIVLDCCDDFPIRQAVDRVAVATRTPLVSGAAVCFDGQITVYCSDLPDSLCYVYLFDGDTADDGAYALFGIFSLLISIIGATQAAEALRVLTGTDMPAHGKLMTYDALVGEWHTFRLERRLECRVCGGGR